MHFRNIVIVLVCLASFISAITNEPKNKAIGIIIDRLEKNTETLKLNESDSSKITTFYEDIYEINELFSTLYSSFQYPQNELATKAIATLFRLRLTEKDEVTIDYMEDRLFRIKNTLKYALDTKDRMPMHTIAEMQGILTRNRDWLIATSSQIFNKNQDIVKAMADDFPECPPPLAVESSAPKLIALLTDGMIVLALLNSTVDTCMGGFEPLCVFALSAAGTVAGVWLMNVVKYFVLCK